MDLRFQHCYQWSICSTCPCNVCCFCMPSGAFLERRGVIGSECGISDACLAQDALPCAVLSQLAVRSFQASLHSVQFQGKETLDVYLHPESLP